MVQVVRELQGDLQAIASELPALVDTLHSDLRQIVRDLGALAKTNMACTDVAKLCAQVSRILSFLIGFTSVSVRQTRSAVPLAMACVKWCGCARL